MKKKEPLSAEERALFQNAMQAVVPLKKSIKQRVVLIPISKKQRVKSDKRDKLDVIPALYDDNDEEISINTPLFYAKTGIQHRVLQRLQRGQIPPASSLDLHGMTRERARAAVQVFLAESKQQTHRCVCIIHGKGLGILKRSLHGWLPQVPDVLAFCSAPAEKEGLSAVYVLLKNQVRNSR